MAVRMPNPSENAELQFEATTEELNNIFRVVGSNSKEKLSTVRMPNVPEVTNPDSRTISFDPSVTTAIRIDDYSIGTRQTWSSSKISDYTQPNEKEIARQFVSNYGELYFSEYNEEVYDDWTSIISDAVTALDNDDIFYVAWSEKRSAQVVNADLNSEPRMTVIINGRSYIMTDTGIVEVPIYNVVIQCNGSENFPEHGSVDRLYIDTKENVMYYWKESIGYTQLTSQLTKLHTLTFGADQQYVYDGSEDVTVPVYIGAVSN